MSATRRPAAVLREAFLPGDAVSLAAAAAALGGDGRRASQALTYLADEGYFVRVRNRLWVRAGAPANPYLVAASITFPFTFAYGTALALHGAATALSSEILVQSPSRFDAFEFEGVGYRHVAPWIDDDRLAQVWVGPKRVPVTGPERTLVECVRVPANAGGIGEVMRAASALDSLAAPLVLSWVDHYGEANLAARVGFVLQAAGSADATLLDELQRRRPGARFYLEPGRRGGRLATRWNMIVPDHLRHSPTSAG